jgi:DNA-3-methyladenine glycosylase
MLSPDPDRQRKVLRARFFARPATEVASDLLGKSLVRSGRGQSSSSIITETEAYEGPHDLACHSSRSRTARTEVMFGPAGRFYVYRIYGLHWMLNVVTGPGAAVLIRAVEDAIGPGRVTSHLDIGASFNGARADPRTGLWFEDLGQSPSARKIVRTARIGVEYAGPVWATKKLRFVLRCALGLPPCKE